jgi:hypothetical protein
MDKGEYDYTMLTTDILEILLREKISREKKDR